MQTSDLLLTAMPQSVLIATAISTGCQQRYFESGMGLDYGVEHHRFESSVHSMLPDDQERLSAAVSGRVASEPDFWGDYTRRAAEAGRRLIDSVRSASTFAEEAPTGQDLLRRFSAVTDAMAGMAPFVVTAPTALGLLRSILASTVEDQLSGSDSAQVSDTLGRLLTPWAEPDPVGEMRNGYRIALEVASDEAASEMFLSTAPRIALARVEEEFPQLYQMMCDHVEDYGWLRARGYRYEPLSTETLIYRVQLVLARWPFDSILRAAHPSSSPDLGQLLGLAPSESMTTQVAALQAMLAQRCFRVDVHVQAECIARPLLGRIADALGCTIKQVLFSSVDEIASTLERHAELPVGEADIRVRNGFSVRRDGDEVVVQAGTSPAVQPGGPGGSGGTLKGMTGCRGTAVGRVRIILDQPELLSLEIGDVLVTAASTIDPTDMTGAGTVFPTRSGGPYDDALDRVVAVVADEGGLLSHAAIVCRERGLPCVLGTETATTSLVDGQIVEVDATKPFGIVIRLLPFA